MTTSTGLPATGLDAPPPWSMDGPAWFILEPPHAVATTVTTRSPRAVLIRTGFNLSRRVVGVGFKNGCRCDPGDVRLAAAVRAPFPHGSPPERNHCYGQRGNQEQTCELPGHAIPLSGS